VHTPEGAARGYEFHRNCPNYYSAADYGSDVMAVIGTGTKEFPPMGAPTPINRREHRAWTYEEGREFENNFWVFSEAVRRAAGVSSIHNIKLSARCFERGPAMVLEMHDWTQVDQAVRNLGSWLAAHDLKGEVVLRPRGVFGPPVF
jgi:hypothetical protein